MRLLEIVKRFAPFLLTFALGLLIASFFVSVAAPDFSNFKRGKRHQNQYLKNENERLQNRINYLERRNAQLESEKLNADSDFDETFLTVPPPPPAPPAPPAPKRVR
jgi:predicted PurR-regulated permease PerM